MKVLYNDDTHQIAIQKENCFEGLKIKLAEGIYLSGKFKKNTPSTKKIIRYMKRACVYGEEAVGSFFRKGMMNKLPVVDNRIVFGTYQNGYACNCKYLAERIIERNLDYELIFIVNEEVYNDYKANNIPEKVKLVRRNTFEEYYALATSKFWMDNAINCIWRRVPKKKEQYYLNAWHGSLGIKRLSGSWHWRNIAKYGDKTIDYFLTDSVFDEHVFSESFWPHADFLKVGHPRNDIFYDADKKAELKRKVYDYYNISYDYKIVMYAPTFRDNKNDISAINIDCDKLKNAVEERFGGKWLVMTRLHQHNARNELTKDKFANLDNVIDAKDYPDMQELMAAVDVGITDYSSWIFDFLFTGMPAFIYAEDIDKYVNSRGFYYPLTETPFSIADSNDKLCENIRNFDDAQFKENVDEFLKARGYYGEGKACDGVIEFLKKPFRRI